MNELLEQGGVWDDPIVAEVRAARSVLFAAAGNDIRELCRCAREQQAVSGHVIVVRGSQSGRTSTRTEPAAPRS